MLGSFDDKKEILYGSLDSGKTISFKGPKTAIGEFVDVKVIDVKNLCLYPFC